eukprot:824028-Amphidinium_carterae.1
MKVSQVHALRKGGFARRNGRYWRRENLWLERVRSCLTKYILPPSDIAFAFARIPQDLRGRRSFLQKVCGMQPRFLLLVDDAFLQDLEFLQFVVRQSWDL